MHPLISPSDDLKFDLADEVACPTKRYQFLS